MTMIEIESTSATTAVLAPSTPATPYEARAVEVTYVLKAHPWFDIDIRREQDYWTVVDRETGIFGHGDDPLEALREFNRAAAEHLDVLERQPELSDELTDQLSYLRERIS